MYKRIIQVLCIAAGLAVIGYVYFKFSGEENVVVDPIDAVPSNFSFFMEISDFNKWSEYRSFVEELARHKTEIGDVSFNPISEWPELVSKIEGLRSSSMEWNTLLQKSHVVFACPEQGRGDSWIISIGMNKDVDATRVQSLMQAFAPIKNQRDFKGTTIQQSEQYQYAIIHDCIVISAIGSFIEDAIIRNEKLDLVRKDEIFMNVREMASKDIAIHFYIAMADRDWMQLDPSFAKDHTLLSGYALLADSSSHSFRLIEQGQDIRIANAVPSNTTVLDVFSYKDFEAGWHKQEEFHMESTASKFWSQAWKDFGDSCKCDLNEAMLSWRSGEWGNAVIATSDTTTAEVSFFLMHDSTDVIALMKPILVEQNPVPGGIYQLRYPQLFDRNQQQNILVESNYVTQVGEVVFTAATPTDLIPVKTIAASLGQESSFQKAEKALSKNAGRFVYQSEYYTSPLPGLLIKCLEGSKYLASSIEHFKENKYLVNIVLPFISETPVHSSANDIQHISEETPENVALEIKQGPWTLINHNTKEKEEAVVTKNNELCLIGSDGKTLWAKKLNSNITGVIHQVDALKNGKLQMAFSTSSEMHLVDRNGNELKGFPISFKTPVTAPLHIADYDGTKKYRMLLGTEDGIYNYTTTGTTTEGWKPEAQLINFITDFRIGNEHHLFTVTPSGSVRVLKRTGNKEWEPATKLEGYNGQSCKIQPGKTFSEITVMYTTKSGEEKTVVLK